MRREGIIGGVIGGFIAGLLVAALLALIAAGAFSTDDDQDSASDNSAGDQSNNSAGEGDSGDADFDGDDGAPTTTRVLPSAEDTLSPPPTNEPPSTAGAIYFNDFVADGSFTDHIVHDIFHRDDSVMAQTSWLGDHPSTGAGDLCGPPTEKRPIERGERNEGFTDDWIYRCVPGGDLEKSHVMTSIGDTSGYSIGCIVPGADGEALVFDGVTEVRWDVNQTDLGDRNFTEVAVIPLETMPDLACDRMPCNTLLPCDTTTHDELGSVGTQWGGLFARMIHTWEEPGGYTQAFGEPGYRCEECPYSPGLRFGSAYGENDPALKDLRIRRSNYFRDNADGTITWGFELDDGSFQDFTVPGSFPEGPVVVVFKHHTYTPLKATPSCVHHTELPCDPSEGTLTVEATVAAGLFTWHWDELTVIGDEVVGTIPQHTTF